MIHWQKTYSSQADVAFLQQQLCRQPHSLSWFNSCRVENKNNGSSITSTLLSTAIPDVHSDDSQRGKPARKPSVYYLCPSSLESYLLWLSPLPELLVHPNLHQERRIFSIFRERKNEMKGKGAIHQQRDRDKDSQVGSSSQVKKKSTKEPSFIGGCPSMCI